MTTAPQILFVEDNEATRYAVNRILSGAGYRIATADTGQKGLALARALKPDLLLLDVRLPDMTGFEIVRLLKADPATASIPVVHLSASHVSSEDHIRGLEGGADAYLTHPVEPRVLVATLTALLRVRLAEARYRRLFETRLLGIVHWSADGTVLDANDAYLRLLGRSRDDIERRTLRWEPRAGEAPAREDEASETTLVRDDGATVPVLVGEARLEGSGDDGVSFVLDISERKRAEEGLREADQRKDEFLGVLSHELRNPLAPIRNAVTILDRVPPGEQADRARAVIARQVDHLTRLVDDLLDVTRISRGKIHLRRATVDLGDILRRTAEDHAALLARDHITLGLRLPDAPVWVDGDPTRLAQIAGNLLANAAKFSNPGGRVVVSLAANACAVLRVRDEGIGIAPELLDRLFVPFAQGDDSLARTRSRGGLGLGLALVKSLVELHGGTVEAHSDGPGLGAELVVALPLTAARASAGAGARRPPRARRVLVVEDNVDAGDTLRDLLRLEGHEVALARTGEEGLAIAPAFRPDVVLCDIGLPGMDGYDVARTLRSDGRLPGLALVALSGYALPEDRRRAQEAGFVHHISKPATIEDLHRVLGAVPPPGEPSRPSP